MRIFLSYASQDRARIGPIRLALTADESHEVFYDRDSLPPGEAYDARMRAAIRRADLFVFFVSPNAVDSGSYTLSELAIAEQTWPHPAGRVLPVVLKDTPMDSLPAYVKAVTFLEAKGNLTADVADAVARIDAHHRGARRTRWSVVVVALLAVLGIALFAWRHGETWFVDMSAKEIRARDRVPARLVPAGTFVMGDDDESPKHEIYLDAFYLDELEVTVSRYAAFMQATGNVHGPDGWLEDVAKAADLPVVRIDWQDAQAYCKWAGKLLPTEAEWEKAARGGDERRYPWGSDEPTRARAVMLKEAEDPYAGGLEVAGSHPAGASTAGVQDLAGNALEWTADWYAESFPSGEVRNPAGAPSGTERVIRGGGWQDGDTRLSATRRWHASPQTRAHDIGFRCARDAE